MGQQAKAKAIARHRKKLFGGRETAEEVHRRIAWGKRHCTTCGTSMR